MLKKGNIANTFTYFFQIIIWNFSYIIMTTYLLGHGAAEQDWVSFDLPSQGSPPTEGCGLSQVRVLFCVPEPHVAEQSAHTVHVLQPPSTDKKEYQRYVELILFIIYLFYYLCSQHFSKNNNISEKEMNTYERVV